MPRYSRRMRTARSLPTFLLAAVLLAWLPAPASATTSVSAPKPGLRWATTGSPVSVAAVVWNGGERFIEPHVYLYLSRDQVAQRSELVRVQAVPILRPGGRYRMRTAAVLRAEMAAGSYRIIACVGRDHVRGGGTGCRASASTVRVERRTLDAYDTYGAYLDWHELEVFRKPIDANGLPLRLGGPVPYSNPMQITQWGVIAYSRWVKGKRSSNEYKKALLAADWLVDHQDPETGMWWYPFSFTTSIGDQRVKAPWGSAMQQGLGISLLVRIHRLTGDARYLRAARAALAPLQKSPARGGFRTPFPGGGEFLEEYPTKRPGYVLNGQMFTMLGLVDLRATAPRKPMPLLDAGLATLSRVLPMYDNRAERISYYHLGHVMFPGSEPETDRFYHGVHITQLQALHSVYPDPLFRFMSRRWQNYQLTPTA